MSRRRLIPITIAVAIVAAAWCFDPMDASVFWPKCPVKWLTGYDCPGCGSSRALHALVHGHPLEAWAHNRWLPFAAAYAAMAVAADLLRSPRLYRLTHHPLTTILFLALTFLWTLLRNL